MDWLFYLSFIFVLYSFVGWCLEQIYSYVCYGHFKYDGFLYGPFKPMYGIAVTILESFYVVLNMRGVPLAFCLITIPTLVEYFSGVIMKKVFKTEYWDYSKNKNNVMGIVCPKFSVYWALLATVIIFLVQPLVYGLYFKFSFPINMFTCVASLYLMMDFILTIKRFIYRHQSLFNR